MHPQRASDENTPTAEHSIEAARTALRDGHLSAEAKGVKGPVAEVVSLPEGPRVLTWLEGSSYRQPPDEEHPLRDVCRDYPIEAELVIWLFGPERCAQPTSVYRALWTIAGPNARLVMATESPWPGKILCPDEYTEHTGEELIASLTRNGFREIGRMVDGPFFRLWQATKTSTDAPLVLSRAEDSLAMGDWAEASACLEGLTESLPSKEAVREYALLVAACHDLAGRPAQCFEALKETLALDENCARAYCGLGRLSALGGNLEAALSFFDKALSIEPALVAALHGRSAVLEAQERFEDAFASVVHASDLRPFDEELIREVIRLGNAIGKKLQVERFVNHINSRRPQNDSKSVS